MAKFSWLGRIGKKSLDQAVDFTAGQTPPGPLDQNVTAFRVVAGVAIVALGFMSWAVIRTINTSAKLPVPKNVVNETKVAALEKLRAQDIDKDGLSDYDELFSYHSSPYLWSSSGDGISDGEKVNKGLDPSCPINKTCSAAGVTNTNASSSTALTASYLRQALKSAGVPASTIDQADDSTLMNMYNQAVATSTANGNVVSNIPQTVSDLNNLSAAEIRKLMQQSGVDATALSKIDDATVKAVFQKALSSDTNTNQ